ncbi:hypothetical protein [Streptomyces carpaticus]|uniref:hypothetical protein n=1 Tax=Streptomyces carpaticus TaxID=285558 RepID=UPI0031F7AE05
MADNGAPFDLSAMPEGLDALGRRLRAEADGKALRRELAKNLRDELKPAAALAKSGIMAMPSAGTMPTSPGLRGEIAKKIRPEVKLGGRWSGARVKARKTRGTRGFANAPKRTQSAKGWRRRVFGSSTWVTQRGRTLWFDRALQGGRERQYQQAVLAAMEAMARRIAGRGR